MKPNKILVTGGGGFLGKYVCKDLLCHGYQVRSLNRSGSEELKALGVDVVMGDICSKNDVKNALNGCDAVIHTAALAGIWGRWDDYRSVNVGGTVNIIEAMVENGIKRLIYTSSPSVVYDGVSIKGADESLPYSKKDYCPYPTTKREAEKYVCQQARHGSIEAISLRPRIIFGPGDPHFFPKLVEKARTGKLRKVGREDHLIDVIYVENAAIAHRLALESLTDFPKLSGRIYFLGQEKPVSSWEFISRLAELGGVPTLKKRVIPTKIAVGIASIVEKAYLLAGQFERDPPMTKLVTLQMGTSHYFSHQAAKDDLSYKPKWNLEESFDNYRRYLSNR